MTPTSPRTLTWATIVAAVGSAVLLALLDPGMPGFEGGGTGRAKMAVPSDAKGAGGRRESPPSTQREHGAADTGARR